LEEIQDLDVVIKECFNRGHIMEWEEQFGEEVGKLMH
jgi:hypothetical protein